MKIAEKINRLRTESDLTQVEFAKIAGVSDKAVSTWERGEKEPRMKSLQKICAYFDVDINQFVDIESDVYKKDPANPKIDEARAWAIAVIDQLSEEDFAAVAPILKRLEGKNKG